jgi:triosephosphate isomerase (TIM)
MRKQIAAANWKMNLTLQQGIKLVDDILEKDITLKGNQHVIFGVPFPYLIPAVEKVKDRKNYDIAAQNCYYQESGAYTGEVSAAMLKSIGTDYVIIGHSERREYFNENHEILAEKINLCFQHHLKPIFCCGEPLSIREEAGQNSFVSMQLRESLFHLDELKVKGMVIAYEPIWAIGTGQTATSEQAQEMHAHIRHIMAGQYGEEVANSISILYGGSVKGSNAEEIFGKPDVDGGLVGGASLKADEFVQIIQALK